MRGGRAVRLALAALFLVGALVAIGRSTASKLDRQGNPALAVALGLPDIQQLYRLSERAALAKTSPSPADLALAREAARRDPLTGDPYFLHGAARRLAGDPRGAARLVDLSLRRDPRFIPAWFWRIGFAAEHRRVADATDAAVRVIEISRDAREQTIPLVVRLTLSPESWPRIRRALTTPTGATWRESYFNQLVAAGVEPSIVFSAIDVVRESSGKPPGVREQEALLSSMVQKGDFERAYTAWLGWLPPESLAKVAYLYDGRFSGAPGAKPFNWLLSGSGDGATSIDKQHGLRIDYTANQPVQLARQVILMTPGRYRMTVVSLLDQPMSQDAEVPLLWQVICLPRREAIATLRLPDTTSAKGAAMIFDVPQGCAAQQLSLEGLGMEFPIRVGGYVRSVEIEKAR